MASPWRGNGRARPTRTGHPAVSELVILESHGPCILPAPALPPNSTVPHPALTRWQLPQSSHTRQIREPPNWGLISDRDLPFTRPEMPPSAKTLLGGVNPRGSWPQLGVWQGRAAYPCDSVPTLRPTAIRGQGLPIRAGPALPRGPESSHFPKPFFFFLAFLCNSPQCNVPSPTSVLCNTAAASYTWPLECA